MLPGRHEVYATQQAVSKLGSSQASSTIIQALGYLNGRFLEDKRGGEVNPLYKVSPDDLGKIPVATACCVFGGKKGDKRQEGTNVL